MKHNAAGGKFIRTSGKVATSSGPMRQHLPFGRLLHSIANKLPPTERKNASKKRDGRKKLTDAQVRLVRGATYYTLHQVCEEVGITVQSARAIRDGLNYSDLI